MKTERRQGAVPTPTTTKSRKATTEAPMSKSEVQTQKATAARIAAVAKQLNRLMSEAREEILATAPASMPSTVRRMLASQSIEVVKAVVREYRAAERGAASTEREAARAEMDRRMSVPRSSSPSSASVRSGRSQSFPVLTADAAKKLIRR